MNLFSSIICAVQLVPSDLKFDKIIARIKTCVEFGWFPKPSLSIVFMHDKKHEEFDFLQHRELFPQWYNHCYVAFLKPWQQQYDNSL